MVWRRLQQGGLHGSCAAPLERSSRAVWDHSIRVPRAWCNEHDDFTNSTNTTKVLFRSVTPIPPSSDHTLTIQGKCTLAIVMLDSFESGSLPGEKTGETYRYPASDVTSFEEIWGTAGTIEVNCVLTQKQLGWAPGGKIISLT